MTALEAIAQREAELTYAAAYDRFAEMEQMLVGAGQTIEAEGAHSYAMLTVAAYRAEMDDRDVGSEVPLPVLHSALATVTILLRAAR